MKFIDKRGRREPRSLTEYRATADLSAKDILNSYEKKYELRNALLEEQGYICCYCMRRIKGERDLETGAMDTRIEHWAAQSVYNGIVKSPDLRLDYKNLIAACRGNEGEPREKEHCDKRKGEEQITLNPTDPSCETKIYYGTSGEILSNNPAIQKEMGTNDLDNKGRGILNLNNQIFKDNRFSAFKATLAWMSSQEPEKEWNRQFLQKMIDKVNSKNAKGYYPEYISYTLYFLKKRLDRANK